MMSRTLDAVRRLIAAGQYRFSVHAVRELSADGIVMEPLLTGIQAAVVVEDYPNYHKGPCVLVLQWDESGLPVHLLWGIPENSEGPAVLVTAYRPDPSQWSADFSKRRQR